MTHNGKRRPVVWDIMGKISADRCVEQRILFGYFALESRIDHLG